MDVFSENGLRGLKQKFKIKTMFVVQNPKNSNLMNIDKFIERKKLAFKKPIGEEIKGKKQVFLFVNATIFDKDNTKTLLDYCYIDLYVVISFCFFYLFLRTKNSFRKNKSLKKQKLLFLGNFTSILATFSFTNETAVRFCISRTFHGMKI